MLIITLSTIPSRFDKIGPTLHSLLAQSRKADRILLYIPKTYRRFPDYDGRLPDVPEGVEIRRIDTDYGPATKVVPAIAEFRGVDCDILFCDDDSIYPRSWAERFMRARAERPGECIIRNGAELWNEVGATNKARALQPRAFRLWRKADLPFQARRLRRYLARRIGGRFLPNPTRRAFYRSGYMDLLGGSGGVLVRPEFFDDDVFAIPDDLRTVDDVWLSGMLTKNGIPIWLDCRHEVSRASVAGLHDALADSVIEGENRDSANLKCVDYMRDRYGIWR